MTAKRFGTKDVSVNLELMVVKAMENFRVTHDKSSVNNGETCFSPSVT